jgi:ABC-type multidrug transport system ATPase subunit
LDWKEIRNGLIVSILKKKHLKTMISIKSVSKSYGAVKALSDINIEVSKGEIFGLIGPDGAGKTTLIRILTTLLLPDTGSAQVMDKDVVNDFRALRREFGYMPGRFSLYEDLTVKENLELFASIFGTTIEENYYLIEDIYKQIEPFKDRRAGKLSGGMKQKLALSCAMIHKPEVIFLDEPTTGVDPVSRKEFWQMLKKLKSHGITIFVSTPYMDEASLCDRIALIQDGHIMSIDTPTKIVQQFDGKLYAIISDKKHGLLKDLREFHSSRSVFLFGSHIHYTDKNDKFEKAELNNYLKQKGHNKIEILEIPPVIEDCFLSLMGNLKDTMHA